ncbi:MULTISPECIES: LacI family DNA-binding transcriptional regulator [Agrococcus]|uniref:LacI family transcriptional regulator n=1 Tax=Agrococcus baldri TaxID=153730 RepID=A0AA87URH2_9MICO|nr:MULTISPECIES: LacI family DNA-binding transcriptional regulator [Agrococcus]MCH1881785.1 LacI family transcriptional regulator [Agrococcus sp. ARC_14]GEK79966.1 LacI family transcriptional regulator [Agrococcus baldri]
MTRRVTSFDVARLAGVSQSTVSRALRNLPNITPATRAKVARAATELRYVPLQSGRSLSTRITGRIAVVSEALTNPFYPQLLEPLRQRLADQGYQTVLIGDHEDDALTVAALSDGSYDGVIDTTASRTSRLPRAMAEAGLPCVLVNRMTDDPDELSCTFDDEAGAARLAGLLIELGHTDFALIAGPEQYSTSARRERGLRTALDEAGLWIPDRRTKHVEFGADSGHRAALELLAQPQRASVLFCLNDVLALGALNAATSLELDVPGDVSVVGFDDIAIAGWDRFALTTVRCDLEALAAEAVDMLTRLVRGLTVDGSRTIEVEVVARQTHAAAKAAVVR